MTRETLRRNARRNEPGRVSIRESAPGQSLYFNGFVGLGDQVYMRPFVLAHAERRVVYLATPWPELYWDHPEVRLVPVHRKLRTQRINVERSTYVWHAEPTGARLVRATYIGYKIGQTITSIFEERCEISPRDFSYNPDPESVAWAETFASRWNKPIAIVRPPTTRPEWNAPARNPKPEYLESIVRAHPEFQWVAIGFLDNKHERLCGNGGYWGSAFLYGELTIGRLAALMQRAHVVLSGPSFTLPMGCALRARIFIVYGGHVPHEMLWDKRLGPCGHVAPEPFCACLNKSHNCKKDIADPVGAFSVWLEDQSRCQVMA